ncbi:MAG: class I SAM-dependent methyltransferase, partial [Clostridia bacterium]
VVFIKRRLAMERALGMIKLSPRLAAIAGQVLKCESAIDVGCDHARLGVWLVQNKIVSRMTVSDINESPLARARKTIDRAGQSGNIECILTNGLCGIAPQDTVIIAGMGGEMIADIIRQAAWTHDVTRMVLQPMTTGEALRQFLFENAFTIEREIIVREGTKLYTILTVVPGYMEVSDASMIYLSDERDALAAAYIKKTLKRLEKALNGMLGARERDETAINTLSAHIKSLKERCEKCQR